jgi:hypothetical protein
MGRFWKTAWPDLAIQVLNAEGGLDLKWVLEVGF